MFDERGQPAFVQESRFRLYSIRFDSVVASIGRVDEAIRTFKLGPHIRVHCTTDPALQSVGMSFLSGNLSVLSGSRGTLYTTQHSLL